MSESVSDATGDAAEAPEVEGLPFLVVGVGASAGGLEAYTELLDGLPPRPGMALLLVSHLDPDQKSHLPSILGQVCRMPVREVVEGMAVEVDHVYVIPPGTNMAMTDGHLKLTPRAPRPVPHMPIDHLFRSLAEIQRWRSVAVVLSGGGSDGTIALQAIKAQGGVTFAQAEDTARFPSMPRSAVLDGNVDHVLRPQEIARELERIARHPHTQAAGPGAPPSLDGDPIAEIIGLVRQRTAVDFAHYKDTTIRRRISRRMALRNIQDPFDYLTILRGDAAEVQSLYQDFLIRVTQFFRDPEAFESLKTNVLPAIIDGRPRTSAVRVWVAGCATGEEAYSIAISLLEYLDGRPEGLAIKILATDLNEVALEKARVGLYLDNIEIDVSSERLRRFFVRYDGHYQISKAVRELCIFSRHNMSVDPPFSRLDLITCRNVLIYMDSSLQRRVVPMMHYALNHGGFLFLGSSESVGASSDLFEVVDARNRVFSRSPGLPRLPMEYYPEGTLGGVARPIHVEESPPLWNALEVQREADRVLLNRYAPVGVVADEAMTVLQFRGRTAPYLEPAPGLASLDLLRMLREGLLADVRGAVDQAKVENASVSREGVRIVEGEWTLQIRVDVIPFKVPPSGVRFFLVLFQNMSPGERVPGALAASFEPVDAAIRDERVHQLQQEINSLRDYLQSVIEEQESTNEELKSANEEILSANEELQSTNEELQTAKEEAQSANEELATVNDELRHRNLELARVNDDLINLLSGVNIPIIMVGRNGRIRRYTPLAEKHFNLIASDVGRPIGDIKSRLMVPDLAALIEKVIDTLVPFGENVQDVAGLWYSLQIRPYVTASNMIEGASVVLVEHDSRPRPAPDDGPPGPAS